MSIHMYTSKKELAILATPFFTFRIYFLSMIVNQAFLNFIYQIKFQLLIDDQSMSHGITL
jgi:hypothetical protein